MTILDLTVPNYQWLIGDFDITDAVDSFAVLHTLEERTSPLIWNGEVQLAYLINQAEFTESFDDWINPIRFGAGNYPVYLYLEGELFQTLRIARLGYTYEEEETNDGSIALATIRLTDILGLLTDNQTPPTDAPGITVGASTRWEVAVQALIEGAIAQVNAARSLRGAAPISVAVDIPLTDIPDVFTAPRTVQSSFVQEAQKICGERGYWLWSDNEVIKLSQYPVAGAPVYQKSRRQLERYNRIQGVQEPLNKLTVAGSCQKADACAAVYPRVRVEYGSKPNGDRFIRRRVTEDRTELGNKITETIQEEAAIIFAYPPGYTFSGDPYATITTQVTRKITTLSNPDRRILQVEEDADKAIGMFEDFRDSFPVASWSVPMPSCQKVITKYNTTDAKQLESIETDTYSPAFQLFSVNGAAPLVQQVQATLRTKVVEKWEKECGDVYKLVTTRYVAPATTGSSANGLIFESEAVEPNSSPPEQPYWEPSFPLTTELISGSAEIDYASSSAYIPNEGTEQCDTLVDNAGCERLARQLINRLWQQYYAREIAHGFESTPGVVLGYEPFQIGHFHQGAAIRSGFGIAMGDSDQGDRKQFVVKFNGNLLGVIPAVPEDPGPAAVPASLINQIYQLSSTVEIGGEWLIIGGPSSFTALFELELSGDWRLEVEILAPASTGESSGDWLVSLLITGPDSTVEAFGDWTITVYPPIVGPDSLVEISGDWSNQIDSLLAPASVVESSGDWVFTVGGDSWETITDWETFASWDSI